MDKFIFVVLFFALLKSSLWTVIVPVFQTPDEKAHFAQLSYFAENKALQVDSEKNLSLEIATAEEILGTRRDNFGNNKYTYHPEYKNNSEIPIFPKSFRTNYVDKEAAMYPPLSYIFTLPFYFLAYEGTVFDRVMLSRIFSIICQIGLVLVAYYIGKLVWDDKLKSVSLAIVVGFQQMISFVGAGIHQDNLLNLIYSTGILVCLLILKRGLRIKDVLMLGVLGLLGIKTKELMFLFFPIAASVVVNNYFLLIIQILAFIFRWPLPYLPISENFPTSLIDYLKFRVPKMAFEIWPWFWGVFKWLGVTLHVLVMKIITRIVLISGIGIILAIFKATKFERKVLVFFILSILSFTVYLVLWDWRLMQAQGFSQGLQGRYFFPNIVPIMATILMGVSYLGKMIKREKVAVSLLAIAMVFLNIYSLWFINSLY